MHGYIGFSGECLKLVCASLCLGIGSLFGSLRCFELMPARTAIQGGLLPLPFGELALQRDERLLLSFQVFGPEFRELLEVAFQLGLAFRELFGRGKVVVNAFGFQVRVARIRDRGLPGIHSGQELRLLLCGLAELIGEPRFLLFETTTPDARAVVVMPRTLNEWPLRHETIA